MLVNADCTVIEVTSSTNITFRAVHYIKEVYWNDCRGRTVSKNGVQTADALIVYLYHTDYIPKPGDIILRGTVVISDGSTQEKASAAVRELKAVNPGFAVVKNVHDARYGGLPHMELIAR